MKCSLYTLSFLNWSTFVGQHDVWKEHLRQQDCIFCSITCEKVRTHTARYPHYLSIPLAMKKNHVIPKHYNVPDNDDQKNSLSHTGTQGLIFDLLFLNNSSIPYE